jgi:hypothetical protein
MTGMSLETFCTCCRQHERTRQTTWSAAQKTPYPVTIAHSRVLNTIHSDCHDRDARALSDRSPFSSIHRTEAGRAPSSNWSDINSDASRSIAPTTELLLDKTTQIKQNSIPLTTAKPRHMPSKKRVLSPYVILTLSARSRKNVIIHGPNGDILYWVETSKGPTFVYRASPFPSLTGEGAQESRGEVSKQQIAKFDFKIFQKSMITYDGAEQKVAEFLPRQRSWRRVSVGAAAI